MGDARAINISSICVKSCKHSGTEPGFILFAWEYFCHKYIFCIHTCVCMFCNVMATFHDKLCKGIVSTELVGYGSYSLCLHDFDCVHLCMMCCCMILFAIVTRQYSHIALTLHYEMYCQMCLNGL